MGCKAATAAAKHKIDMLYHILEMTTPIDLIMASNTFKKEAIDVLTFNNSSTLKVLNAIGNNKTIDYVGKDGNLYTYKVVGVCRCFDIMAKREDMKEFICIDIFRD